MMKLPATFDGFASHVDGSFGLRFSTQEMTGGGLEMLASHVRLFGWLLFSEQDVQEKDIPEEIVEKDVVSPSKRMYNVLFILHKQLIEEGKTVEPFNIWRERQMEKMIDALKAKLH